MRIKLWFMQHLQRSNPELWFMQLMPELWLMPNMLRSDFKLWRLQLMQQRLQLMRQQHWLWRSRMRIAGAGVAALGLAIGGMAVPPDLIVSGDGRHAAIVQSDGSLAFLRERAGGYIRDMWGDATAATAQPALIDLPSARCTRDACVTDIARDGRRWRLLATLSRDRIDRPVFEPACAAADIVVSDRRMPRWCRPRWLKLDRAALGESGAVAVWFDGRRIETVHERLGDHPWRPRPPPLLQRQRGRPWTVVNRR